MSNERRACLYDPFCLDGTDCPGAHLKETESPSRTVMNLGLTIPRSPNASAASPPPAPTATLSAQGESSLPPPKRFKFSNENELEEMAKGFTPANTNRVTQWALKVFQDWRTARNKHLPVEQAVLENLLASSDP